MASPLVDAIQEILRMAKALEALEKRVEGLEQRERKRMKCPQGVPGASEKPARNAS